MTTVYRQRATGNSRRPLPVARMRKYTIFAICFLIVFALIPTMSRAAGFSPMLKDVNVTSTAPIDESKIASAVLIDAQSGEVLYAYAPDKVWPAASITKLMTSHVFASTPTKWTMNGTITKVDEVGGGRLQVPSGSVMTLRDVLYSALIGSANNAAEAMGRMFDKKGKDAFVLKMNERTRALGLIQSQYFDTSGMNEKNTISAYDTAIMIKETAEEPESAKAMSLATYSFTVKKPVIKKTIKSTNDLLFSQNDLVITGGKTGFINEAKYNFVVSAYPKGHPEKELVAVILGAETRAISQEGCLSMLRWAWDAYDWMPSTSTAALPVNRELGDKGDDILRLQKYLNANGFVIAKTGAGSPGKETPLFGSLTKAALIRYQEARADRILAPHGATVGSGYLDFYTRSAINRGI